MAVQVSLLGDTMHVSFSATDELDRCPNRIIDLTAAAAIGIGYAELSGLAMKRASEQPRNRYNIVFVANSDVGFGISRIYQSLAEHADISVLRAETLEEALLLLAA